MAANSSPDYFHLSHPGVLYAPSTLAL